METVVKIWMMLETVARMIIAIVFLPFVIYAIAKLTTIACELVWYMLDANSLFELFVLATR